MVIHERKSLDGFTVKVSTLLVQGEILYSAELYHIEHGLLEGESMFFHEGALACASAMYSNRHSFAD